MDGNRPTSGPENGASQPWALPPGEGMFHFSILDFVLVTAQRAKGPNRLGRTFYRLTSVYYIILTLRYRDKVCSKVGIADLRGSEGQLAPRHQG